MDEHKQPNQKKGISSLTGIFRYRLIRFMVSGLLALVISLSLILFMRYLVLGYDDSSTGTIMRYFTLNKLPLTAIIEEDEFSIERPGDRPELPGIDDSDEFNEPDVFLETESIDISSMSSPVQEIERDIMSPQLQDESMSAQEKFQLIKQEILSEDEWLLTSAMQDLNTGSENESQQVLEINTNCIELYKVLKLEGLADSGGMAKMLIGKGLVYVNGQIETRKRKKIIAGDTVEYEGKQVSIRSNK